MEQWRLFLAIILSIFVFLLWEVFFAQPPGQQPQKTDPAVETARPEDQRGKPSGKEPEKASQPLGPEAGESAIPEQSFESVTIDTALYTARISQRGAALTSFILHKYREDVDKDSAQKQLVSDANRQGTALLHMAGASPDQWFNARYSTDFESERLSVREQDKHISFFWESPTGAVIEKRYTFRPDSYKVLLDVIIKNPTSRTLSSDMILTLQNPIPKDSSRFAFEGPLAYLNKELEEIDVDDIGEKSEYTGDIEWTGMCSRYFMTVLIPQSDAASRFTLARNPESDMIAVNYVQPLRAIEPNMQDGYHFSLYMGPKRLSELRQYGDNLTQAVNFGWFDIIAKPCLWAMNAIYNNFFPNYGVAIILLTMGFKILFWPLGSKSYKSMAEMKKLQPLMAEIRKKYKDDKKKMNEEVMRLYRTYKVNPMSGCLPMVVQIPVFIAFYRMLYEAIELRHAPFMLWINDLSAPDRLFHFDVSIPLMLPPYGIPVLTIIMGATMFLQQKLSPPPGDPSQAKFMMMMPLIFTVIFVNFPSGLVLYWLVNNVISIGQQYYITKKVV